MEIAKFQKVIERGWTDYQVSLFELARQAFEQYVKPFCVARNCRFLAGNGTWYIDFEKDGQRYAYDWSEEADGEIRLGCYTGALVEVVEDDPELKAVLDVLRVETPGLSANDLGSLMPSYEKKNYLDSVLEREAAEMCDWAEKEGLVPGKE